jgi:hypothetical protein
MAATAAAIDRAIQAVADAHGRVRLDASDGK